MRWVMPFVLLVAFVVLIACAKPGPVCTAPYMTNGNTCCLDKDANKICDVDESVQKSDDASVASAELDCKLCPPQFVTQKVPVTVYKYICMNATIVDKPEDCGIKQISNAYLFKPNVEQDNTIIKGFSIRPACRGSVNAAELHLTLFQQPANITIQYLDDPDGTFADLGVAKGASDIYYYIGFCADNCTKLADAQLPPDKAYLIRAMFTSGDGKQIFTKEIIVDDTGEGDFGKKVC